MKAETGFIDQDRVDVWVRAEVDLDEESNERAVEILALETDPDGEPWHGPLTREQLEDVCEELAVQAHDAAFVARRRAEDRAGLMGICRW